ncbi:MAG: hypothetical protein L0Y71_13560 [Gemmataceae bacterium]|nr:hypothetical protein [Gemmataceae bacterium]
MDDFTKLHAMRAQGASPEQIYATAKADGIDEITCIRLLRKVCSLGLAEAKSVSEAGRALNAHQHVNVGETVYWEGWDTVQRFFVMEAKVTRLVGDRVQVNEHRKYLVTPSGLEEVAIEEPMMQTIPLGYFEKPLADRLGESLQFVLKLTEAATR